MLARGVLEEGPPSPPRSNNGEQVCDLQGMSTGNSNLMYPVGKPVYGAEGQLISYQLSAYDSPDTLNEQPHSQLLPYQASDYNPDMGSSMESRLQEVHDVQEPMVRPGFSIPPKLC